MYILLFNLYVILFNIYIYVCIYIYIFIYIRYTYSNYSDYVTQVENEYGSYYANDRLYTRHLRNEFIRYLGKDVLLFTTDGASIGYLNSGTIDGVYATVDFAPGQ